MGTNWKPSNEGEQQESVCIIGSHLCSQAQLLWDQGNAFYIADQMAAYEESRIAYFKHTHRRWPFEKTTIAIDAVRFVPNTWTVYQGRTGDGTAIPIDKREFEALDVDSHALHHPNAWVVLDQPARVEECPLEVIKR